MTAAISLAGASDGTAAKQPRLRRPYARGVKTQAEDSPPPPAAAAPSGTASSGGSDGGNVAKETKHSSKPNLGAILAGGRHVIAGALINLIGSIMPSPHTACGPRRALSAHYERRKMKETMKVLSYMAASGRS